MGWKSLQEESVGYICQSLVSCDCPSHIQLDGQAWIYISLSMCETWVHPQSWCKTIYEGW